MLTLGELKDKWFIDTNSTGSEFPPLNRHTDSQVRNATDGNLITPLIEGSNYMREFHDSLRAMFNKPDCELYLSGWSLTDVRTLGDTNEESDALFLLRDAHRNGVKTYVLASGHITKFFSNSASLGWLILKGIWTAEIDERYPAGGSNHHKFICLKDPTNPKALVGSIDITEDRWDQSSHETNNPERSSSVPTHEIGVLVQGPAVIDIEHVFRSRWNDSGSLLNPDSIVFRIRSDITTPVSTITDVVGSHSVQVLQTYGRSKRFGYSWSPAGEFTIWASHLNAIMKATNYIYIEDQYFFSFGWPAAYKARGRRRDTDIIYQLGEAIKRGVKVIVLVAREGDGWPIESHQIYQRDEAAFYLNTVAEGHSGDFIIASLYNGTEWVYVHSKLMICDDEFVSIGSANINRRSMTHDGELQLGIVDENNIFARDLRKKLWSEHLQRPENTLAEITTAMTIFKDDVTARNGRVRPYLRSTDTPPWWHKTEMDSYIDPYAGPPF